MTTDPTLVKTRLVNWLGAAEQNLKLCMSELNQYCMEGDVPYYRFCSDRQDLTEAMNLLIGLQDRFKNQGM